MKKVYEFITVQIQDKTYDLPKGAFIPRIGETVFFDSKRGVVCDVIYQYLDGFNTISIKTKD